MSRNDDMIAWSDDDEPLTLTWYTVVPVKTTRAATSPGHEPAGVKQGTFSIAAGKPKRVMIRPPSARIGPITPEERKAIMDASPFKGKYDTAIDAESAYEILQKRIAGTTATADGSAGGGILGKIGTAAATIFGTNVKRGRLSTGQLIARNVTRSVTNTVVGGAVADLGKSVGGSIGGSVGRALVRGALGGLLRR